MSNKGSVPDAWDDDWVESASRSSAAPKTEAAPKLSKAERRAQHREQQQQLWDSADNPGRNIWLEAQGAIPNRQELKPQVTLLSRKPQIAKRNVNEGDANLSLQDEDDSEEEARKKQANELEERQRKAKLEREEKQRRYAEARERIMGSSQPSPATASRESSHGRDTRKQRVRVGGSRRSQPETPAEQSPARIPTADRQLFDPEEMGRRLAPRRETSGTPKDEQPVRQPRGPNHSGRGGFGFFARGGGPNA